LPLVSPANERDDQAGCLVLFALRLGRPGLREDVRGEMRLFLKNRRQVEPASALRSTWETLPEPYFLPSPAAAPAVNSSTSSRSRPGVARLLISTHVAGDAASSKLATLPEKNPSELGL